MPGHERNHRLQHTHPHRFVLHVVCAKNVRPIDRLQREFTFYTDVRIDGGDVHDVGFEERDASDWRDIIVAFVIG